MTLPKTKKELTDEVEELRARVSRLERMIEEERHSRLTGMGYKPNLRYKGDAR